MIINNYMRNEMQELGLWAMVVICALKDACGTCTGANSHRTNNGMRDAKKKEAQYWLTSKYGDVAKDRRRILDFLSIDEEVFNKLVSEMQASGWDYSFIKERIRLVMVKIYGSGQYDYERVA